jgi:hypothetical protein
VTAPAGLPLAVVDATTLDADVRGILRPGDTLEDADGRGCVLPRWFYRVESWEQARELMLTPHFALWELITVDVREARPQVGFPRYVPCAITLLAAHLEVVRELAGTYVHIAANGGYRSPAHRLTRHATPHCWGTAANIYRIGDDYLDTPERIGRYAEAVRRALPGVWVRPWGAGPGQADDHLHIDLGHVLAMPREAGAQPARAA